MSPALIVAVVCGAVIALAATVPLWLRLPKADKPCQAPQPDPSISVERVEG